MFNIIYFTSFDRKWPKYYESTSWLIQSYSSDLVYGVTRNKVITAKHFLLGLRLHNITSQKKPVEINHRLGHSIDYKGDVWCPPV